METTEYEIDSWYQVPTVYAKIYDTLIHWPIIGPMHSDAEIIGFPYLHYHIDWRFVTKRVYESMLSSYRSEFGLVVHTNVNVSGLPEPVIRRLRCKRQFNVYPYKAAKWLFELEEKYKDCRLKTLVCPHQGLPLDKLPCKHGELVTCPGHGLTWNIKAGWLVRGMA